MKQGLIAAAILVALAAAALIMLRDQPAVQEGPPTIGGIDTVSTRGRTEAVAEIVDEPAPAFTLPTLDGDSLSLSDLDGQVVVINFWATWCAPCRVEIPDLIEMQEELRDDGVRFVGISLDSGDVDAVRAFADDAGFNYPIVLDDGDVADEFGGIYALPTTVLIDRDGVVVRKIPGLVTKSQLMPLLAELSA